VFAADMIVPAVNSPHRRARMPLPAPSCPPPAASVRHPAPARRYGAGTTDTREWWKLVALRPRKPEEVRQKQERDALELPDGNVVLVTHLSSGQRATVLQLPVTHQAEQATPTAEEHSNRNTPASAL
jgi:hypothetical protein